MDERFFVELALKIAGGLFAIVSVLVALLWQQINKKLDKIEASAYERLRTLGHEDRAIRGQIHDLLLLFTDRSKMIDSENEKLKWMLSEAAKMNKGEANE